MLLERPFILVSLGFTIKNQAHDIYILLNTLTQIQLCVLVLGIRLRETRDSAMFIGLRIRFRDIR